MQSYWMTVFSCAGAGIAAAAAMTSPRKIRFMPPSSLTRSSRSELDLQLRQERRPPLGAARVGAVSVAVHVLADRVDLKPRPAVEPDVGPRRDGGHRPAVDRVDRGALELRVFRPHDPLEALPLRLAPGDPVTRLGVAAVELDVLVRVVRIVREIDVQPLGVERALVLLPMQIRIPAP